MQLWWTTGWYEWPTLLPGAIKCSVLCSCQGPCLNPWSYHSWGLCRHLCPVLPWEAIQMPVVWGPTWSHVDFQEEYCFRDNMNLSALCFLVLGSISEVMRVYPDVLGLGCHHKPFRCSGSELPPEATLVPNGHASASAIPIWVAYAAIQDMVISRTELQPRVMSGSVEDNEIKRHIDSSLYTIVFRKLFCSN